MTKESIEKMIDRYDAVYEKNYRNHQETGASRYLNEARKAEDIVDVCRQALSAADDHEAALHAQLTINQLAGLADRCRNNGYPEEEAKATLDQVISIAKNAWGYKSPYMEVSK